MEQAQLENQVEEAKLPPETSSGVPAGDRKRSGGFPHDLQSDHWDADFSNSKEVYEGMALPIWILAGWAIFIIWAVVYLTAGARTVF